MKIIPKGKFDTIFGTTFLIEKDVYVKVGDKIFVDDTEYVIKKIIMPTTPETNLISIVV